MARLLTGEFNDRAAAESTIEDLVRAGVPREQIYIETELPPDTMRGRKGGEVEMAEAERRIAGTETGFLVGSVLGLLGGMLAATINEALVIATQRGVAMGWPFSSVQMAAVSSRFDSAERIAFFTATVTFPTPARVFSNTTVKSLRLFQTSLGSMPFTALRMDSRNFRPASISSSPALPFFLLVDRFTTAFSWTMRSIRSGLAWKLSRSGRSTVILR